MDLKPSTTWRDWVFVFVMFGSAQFVLLTLLGMLFFPGGTFINPASNGYSFFMNFFSDLGRTHTLLGASNRPAFILFTAALFLAGLSLSLFYIAIPALFTGGRVGRWLSILGSVFGIISGLSFTGIALTPADLLLEPHQMFVTLAFTSFFLAVLCYLPATIIHPSYPKTYAWVYLGFAVVLGIYLLLFFLGPSPGTSTGLIIQATGQKTVVYAAILCMFIQGFGARNMGRKKL